MRIHRTTSVLKIKMARLAIGVTVSILSILPVCMSQFELPPGATPVPTNPPGKYF